MSHRLASTFDIVPESVSAAPLFLCHAPAADAARVTYRDGEVFVFADARLDDIAALAAALGMNPAAGAAPLIAAAWRKWGERCPERLLGDYAVVILDRGRDILFCARDHIGARPFFYATIDGAIAFANHVAVLQQAAPHLTALDDRYIATALADRRFEPLDLTYCTHIRKLPPGHTLTIKGRGGIKLASFWQPQDSPDVRLRRREDYVEAARELIERAVTDRLRTSRRSAVHLSGGLDSSTVAAITVRALAAAGLDAPVAYSWQPVDPHAPPGTESGWTETMRAYLALKVFAPELGAADLADLLRMDRTNQFDVRNLFHELAVQRDAAERGVDLILSGWGGDEGISFNGRGYRAELLRGLRLVKLAQQASHPGLRGAAGQVRAALSELRLAGERFPNRKQFATNFLNHDFLRQVRPYPSPHVAPTSYRQAQAHLLRRTSITQRLEDWAISGARHGLSYAYPLLDRRVLEFACGLPPDLYQGVPQTRTLMREAARPYLPEAIRTNNAKLEPVRVGRVQGVYKAALMAMGEEIASGARTCARAHYLDMPRLLRALQAPDAVGSKSSAMRLAVQFLDC